MRVTCCCLAQIRVHVADLKNASTMIHAGEANTVPCLEYGFLGTHVASAAYVQWPVQKQRHKHLWWLWTAGRYMFPMCHTVLQYLLAAAYASCTARRQLASTALSTRTKQVQMKGGIGL